MMEGRKWAHTKRVLKLQCFSPLKILTSPFHLKRLLELSFSFFSFFFLFVSLFFNTFSLFFSMLHLFEGSRILIIFEEKNNLRKFFSNAWDDMANP
jgi:hypothetical protein